MYTELLTSIYISKICKYVSIYRYTHTQIHEILFSIARCTKKIPFHIYSSDCSYRIQYTHSLTGCHSKSGILFYMHTCSTFDGLFSCINTCMKIANPSRFKCPHITNMGAENGEHIPRHIYVHVQPILDKYQLQSKILCAI